MALPRTGRKMRNPTHTFYLEHMPFQIQPFMCAPVLPGETLKNAVFQSRVVTDPILNKLIGWWLEYHFFYVKHRDMDGRDDFEEMFLDPTKDMSAYNINADVTYDHFGGAPSWTKLATTRVIETWFREEDENAATATINSVPSAAINGQSWLDSALLKDDFVVSDPTLTVGVDDVITGSEVDKLMSMWELQRSRNLTEMTFDDFLASYGVATPKVELHRPELLRSVREWQYPSNTIDPTTGAAKSAVSWAIQDRLDKDRFFGEPGFILGLTIARPKVYLKNLDGQMADIMNSAIEWLPALMKDDPMTSLSSQSATEGPLATIVSDSDGYIVDVKDLFLHGDQFVNVAKSGAGLNMVTLPNAALSNKNYPTDADVDGLFVGSTDATRQVRQDGVVRLSILGGLTDTTPSNQPGRSS